jgi:hypothetical protein
MNRTLNLEEVDAALKRAAHKAVYGTREDRAGSFSPIGRTLSSPYDPLKHTSHQVAPVIEHIRAIVRRPGFLHTLSLLVTNESIFGSKSAVKARNRFKLVSFHEIGLLLSLISEAPIDIRVKSASEIDLQYNECKRLLDDLHTVISNRSHANDFSKMFSDGPSFIEPIFYAASSAFWFDYLELAPQLYELDQDFLETKGYPIHAFAELLQHMYDIFRRRYRDFVRDQRKNLKRRGLIRSPFECFLFSSHDIAPQYHEVFRLFIERFSIKPGSAPLVTDPVSFHPAKSRPALRLAEGILFVPLIPMLCEQLFENPFYVIAADKDYFARNANNRGIAAESIVARLLKGVRHLRVFSDVKLYRNSKLVDQIDAMAIFGVTAVLFEAKTKRLTEASKQGDTKKLIEDVERGIIEAQMQLADSKALILSKNYDEALSRDGDLALLSNVTKVVCISIMTHEIPSYPLIIRTILEKKNLSGIIPITIFDLKVISFYLDNAFEFLYYWAIRSVLDRDLMYGTEQGLLGYHFKARLALPDNAGFVYVDDDFGQSIDANYPSAIRGEEKRTLQFGIAVVDDIIRQIINTGDPAMFRLFSAFRGMSGEAAKELKHILRQLERMVSDDGRAHDGTILFKSVALTFVLANSTADAAALVRGLMHKRDLEKKFDQEYIMTFLPETAPEMTNLRSPMKSRIHSNHLVLVAYAMKQRNLDDDEITAFSPRLSSNEWNVSDKQA